MNLRGEWHRLQGETHEVSGSRRSIRLCAILGILVLACGFHVFEP